MCELQINHFTFNPIGCRARLCGVMSAKEDHVAEGLTVVPEIMDEKNLCY